MNCAKCGEENKDLTQLNDKKPYCKGCVKKLANDTISHASGQR